MSERRFDRPLYLVLAEHDRGRLASTTLEALTVARRIAATTGADVDAVAVGALDPDDVARLAGHGARRVHLVDHDMLDDYNPAAWGAALRELMERELPAAVLAAATGRGNEVLAQTAARVGLPFAASCTRVEPGETWELERLRWGGSLVEEAVLDAPVKLLTIAPHVHEAAPVAAADEEGGIVKVAVDLPASLESTRVRDRVTRDEGITLATAPVVVSGGRGVGGADGFAVLEELAALLGGAVGCSRVATNAGWRPHSDQVGQTGTQIAPDVYIACGISGAIQHWVGCMNAKAILAINTDADAPMVTRADYAVLGDLHEVLPAVIEELRARRPTDPV